MTANAVSIPNWTSGNRAATRRNDPRRSVGVSPDAFASSSRDDGWATYVIVSGGSMRSGMRFAVAAGAAAALLVQPVAAHAAVPPVDWGACAADVLAHVPAGDHGTYTCATYQVPLDYAHPSAGTVSLALLRRAA